MEMKERTRRWYGMAEQHEEIWNIPSDVPNVGRMKRKTAFSNFAVKYIFIS